VGYFFGWESSGLASDFGGGVMPVMMIDLLGWEGSRFVYRMFGRMRLKRRDDGPVDGVSFFAGISADAVFAASGSSGGVDADADSGIGIPTTIIDLFGELSLVRLTHFGPMFSLERLDDWLIGGASFFAGIPADEVSAGFGSAGCDLAWLTPSRRSLLAVMCETVSFPQSGHQRIEPRSSSGNAAQSAWSYCSSGHSPLAHRPKLTSLRQATVALPPGWQAQLPPDRS
jgi:hypothetical protein